MKGELQIWYQPEQYECSPYQDYICNLTSEEFSIIIYSVRAYKHSLPDTMPIEPTRVQSLLDKFNDIKQRGLAE